MSSEFQLYLSLGYCLFMLILFGVLIKYTPEKVNRIYGYRTPLSMKNQNTWEVANTYANKFMMRLSYWSFILSVVLYFTFPEENFFLTIIIHSFLLICVLIFTERHLKATFDSDGNRKEPS